MIKAPVTQSKQNVGNWKHHKLETGSSMTIAGILCFGHGTRSSNFSRGALFRVFERGLTGL